MEDDPLDLITPDELADLMSVKKNWVYEQANAGKIPAFRIGRLLRFRRSELEPWLQMQKVG